MWYVLILSVLLLAAVTVSQTPGKWIKNKLALAAVAVFHTLGILSFALLLFFFPKIGDAFWREAILTVETVYFSFILFSALLAVLRQGLLFSARHLHLRKISAVLAERRLFVLFCAALTVLYLIPAVPNAVSLTTVRYSVQTNASCETKNLRIALLADQHVGAGADCEQLAEMTRRVNEMQPDLVIIAGDVADSSSSPGTLVELQTALEKIKCRYGIYYAEGNHEKESNYDPVPYLSAAGVRILHDEVQVLPCGVAVVGRCDKRERSVADILRESGTEEMPCIVIQHRPNGLKRLQNDCDLVLCGHTHGYQYPFISLAAPFTRDFSCGKRQYGNMTAICTSGVSQWGYRAKWPSRSEVVQIDLSFT